LFVKNKKKTKSKLLSMSTRRINLIKEHFDDISGSMESYGFM